MQTEENLTVFDVGGSIVAPDGPDTDFLQAFFVFLEHWLKDNPLRRIILVVGGGSAARVWQGAARTLVPQMSAQELDWVGIMATRLNAELLRTLSGSLCLDPVVTDPTADFSFTGKILVAAGWKPGFSTDYDAVILAERFSARRVIMLSNIAQIYDSDPNVNPSAKAIRRLTWAEYTGMAGTAWVPGANIPFDPVATAKAAKTGLSVVAVSGRNLENLQNLLAGRDYIGTEIVPVIP